MAIVMWSRALHFPPQPTPFPCPFPHNSAVLLSFKGTDVCQDSSYARRRLPFQNRNGVCDSNKTDVLEFGSNSCLYVALSNYHNLISDGLLTFTTNIDTQLL